MRVHILELDQTGHPREWLTQEEAILKHYKGQVAFQIGDADHTVFRGGVNRMTGEQSRIWTAPIIAIKNKKAGALKTPSLSNSALFVRDRYTCAYCGKKFHEKELTRDHVIPVSRGGKDVWTNVVTACQRDNHKKDDYLLHEVGMELLYVPYKPSPVEDLILRGRKILPIQAEYLSQFVPSESRTYQILQELMNVH